jgi:hypothetical protein
VLVSLLGHTTRLMLPRTCALLPAPSSSTDVDEESSRHFEASIRSLNEGQSAQQLPVDSSSAPGGGPSEVLVTGEIVACAVCGLNEMPELWSFLVEGEVDYYHGITTSWTRSGSPQVILTVYNNGRYADSVVLSDNASWTKRDYHRLVRECGFALKDEDGRKAAKEAAEKEIRDEAAWRRYRGEYFDRRSRHVYEFMSLVMVVLPRSCASEDLAESCFTLPSVNRAPNAISPVATSVLESNYDRNNPRRLHYVRTGRWPKRRRRQKTGSNPIVPPETSTEAEKIETKNSISSEPPRPSSLLYPAHEKPSSYLILQQRKADIEEKIRAIKRKRIAFQTTDIASQSSRAAKTSGRRSAREGKSRRTRRRRKRKGRKKSPSVLEGRVQAARSRRKGGDGDGRRGARTDRTTPREQQRSKSGE